MKINKFIENLDKIINDLAEITLDVADGVALDAKALLQRRIQETGIDANGNKFIPYSKNKLPLFFFGKVSNKGVLGVLGIDENGKKTNKKPRRKKVNGVLTAQVNPYADGISYEDWRKLMGLPVDHVTLTVTEEMWKKIGVLAAAVEGDNLVRVRVGGRDTETKKKMGYIAERRGDFMALSKDEKEFTENRMNTGVASEIIRRLGS